MKEFENKILDDLYELRGEEVEQQYISKYGDPEEKKKLNKVEEEFVDLIKEVVKDSKDIQSLLDKLDEFEICTMAEMWFWYKEYYKVGFIDGITLREQIREEKNTFLNSKINNRSDTFFYKNIHTIEELVGQHIWENRKDYKELMEKMNKIKEKYPNIAVFLEDNEIVQLSIEELKALYEYLILADKTKDIELVETFILGLKDNSLL